jgi:hypothetical protein
MDGDNGEPTDPRYQLTARERAMLPVYFDAFEDLVEKRFGITAAEVIEIAQEHRNRKQLRQLLLKGGLLAFIGLVAVTVAQAGWEMFRQLILRGGSQ